MSMTETHKKEREYYLGKTNIHPVTGETVEEIQKTYLEDREGAKASGNETTSAKPASPVAAKPFSPPPVVLSSASKQLIEDENKQD